MAGGVDGPKVPRPSLFLQSMTCLTFVGWAQVSVPSSRGQKNGGHSTSSRRKRSGHWLQREGESQSIRVLLCILLARSSVSRMPSSYADAPLWHFGRKRKRAKLRPIPGGMSRAENTPPLGPRSETPLALEDPWKEKVGDLRKTPRDTPPPFWPLDLGPRPTKCGGLACE